MPSEAHNLSNGYLCACGCASACMCVCLCVSDLSNLKSLKLFNKAVAYQRSHLPSLL